MAVLEELRTAREKMRGILMILEVMLLRDGKMSY